MDIPGYGKDKTGYESQMKNRGLFQNPESEQEFPVFVIKLQISRELKEYTDRNYVNIPHNSITF